MCQWCFCVIRPIYIVTIRSTKKSSNFLKYKCCFIKITISINDIVPFAVNIYPVNRVVCAICVWAYMVILLAQRIHPVPRRQQRVVEPCAVVVGVAAVHRLELLAVVLIRLEVGVHRGVVAEGSAEGIVVHYLLYGSVGIDNGADVALVVAVIVMVADSVTVERAIASPEKVLRRHAVLKDEVAQVVSRVCAQRFALRQLARLPEGHAYARHCRAVHRAQLYARNRIDVLRHAAVHELHTAWIAARVVVYLRYPAVGVARQGAVSVIGVFSLALTAVGEVHRSLARYGQGVVVDVHHAVAVKAYVQVIYLAVNVVLLESTPLETLYSSVLRVLEHGFVIAVGIGRQALVLAVDGRLEPPQSVVVVHVAAYAPTIANLIIFHGSSLKPCRPFSVSE